jgi:hypothetical protein
MRGILLAAVAAAVVVGCGGAPGTPDATPRPAWHKGLPEASVMGDVRGLHPARGIIHLHSPYSHDACDGDPRGASGLGPIDEACLADLRAALCTDRIDFAALTDHDDSMADEDFANLFVMRGDDEEVDAPDGHQLASRIHCTGADAGHTVLVTVGGENEIMPIMLDRHVAGDVATRHATYNGDDPTAVAAFRAAGATVWIAHTEQRTTAHLEELAPDGIELYNLHANIDPKIRPTYLGLSADGAIAAVAEFADTGDPDLEPDLALISFLAPSGPALARWNELLAAGDHMPASAGTDAHENAFPITLIDGERGDSYRRMMRWFANVALVADPTDPIQIEDAIRAGRFFVAFELFGTPVGFDAAVHAGGAVAGMGDTVPATAGATFDATVPAIYDLDPALPAPELHARLVRVDAGGVHELATGGGPTLSAPAEAPGAYRVEISIVPRHLGPYLGHLGTAPAEQELPWIYGNPIYVTAPPP